MTLKTLLEKKKVILSDGSWGTALRGRGAPDGCPELWNENCPELIQDLVKAYVAAGSDVVLTNSFGGSAFKLAGYDLADKTEALNEQAARLSKTACGDACLVLASVGPTGKFMEPYGPVTEAEMTAAFRRQIKALLQGGADGIAVETMSDLGEATCAVKAAQAEGAGIVLASMTFEPKKSGMVTMMGVTPEQAADAMSELGCDLIGANCGSGIDDMVHVIRAMKPRVSVPLWAKPNAGLPQVVDGATVYPETPEQMAGKFSQLIDAGARFLGGCCGTSPDYIAALKQVL